MPTPLPEPYDITDIPHIAWVPGISAWIAAALALGILAVYLWTRNASRSRYTDTKVIDKLLSELRAAVQASETLHIERTSRIARRIVSFISGRNVAELTSEELRASIDERTPSHLRAVVEGVATFEEIAYAPPSPERDSSARELGAKLVTLIADYRNHLRAQ